VFWAQDDSGGDGFLSFTVFNDADIQWAARDGKGIVQITVGSGIAVDTWFHIVGTHDATAGDWELFLDATSVGTATSDGTYLNIDLSAYVASNNNDGSPDGFFNGQVDEVRVTLGELTSQYVTTAYNNQNSPSTFYAVGAQEIEEVADNSIFFGMNV